MTTAVILGSACEEPCLDSKKLIAEKVNTAFGEITLFRYPIKDPTGINGRTGWILFRHGAPHHYLPNQIPFRTQAAALQEVGCRALLVTSSVGVLDSKVPLDTPILVNDLLMPDNRLPDGSACTMFTEPAKGQGHLVLDQGLFSKALGMQVEKMLSQKGWPLFPGLVFAYAQGPRNKTKVENRFWASMGAQVNSMTLAPEVVLANELEIPTAAVVVGHKYSIGQGERERHHPQSIADALQKSKKIFEEIAVEFLTSAEPVEFGNHIYRY